MADFLWRLPPLQYDESIMPTKWIAAVIQITADIRKIEDEIIELEAVILDKKARGISAQHESSMLRLRQAGLVICRENLKNLLDATRFAADWQISDPDDVA